MENMELVVKNLNHKDRELRIQSVKCLKQALEKGSIPKVQRRNECNNHIHSQYSFSPYSPSKIAWLAYAAGLSTCGIVDHESVGGCEEFREACGILGIMPTIGFEIRLSWDETPLFGRRFNNPDQRSIGYFPVHGVPVRSLRQIEEFLMPIRRAREQRNRLMVKKIDDVLEPFGMDLDFDEHVIPESKWLSGGSITERHLLYAAGKQMIQKFGKGHELRQFLQSRLGVLVSETAGTYLEDKSNPCYEFDLTNLLKGFFSDKIYLPAAPEETPDITSAVPMLTGLGCIPAYTYLGDIPGESVTGDKKAQKFEDEILEDLFMYGHQYGLRAVSYAPGRNSKEQLNKVRRLCRSYHMLEICGEDINQPRQQFISRALKEEEKSDYNDVAWALVGHERLSEISPAHGILSEEASRKYPSMKDRILAFKVAGKEEEARRSNFRP